MMWSDDGIVFRLPGSDSPPPLQAFFPSSESIEDIVVRELGSTALFASRFRENAARALLLPRRQPGRRTPLWLQRRKSADLLAVAANYERFPIMLETFRECLRDVFDLPGLKRTLRDVEQRAIRLHQVETTVPSPFAASLLFMYTANFLYNGDTPLAERRAATLSLDLTQLRELLGDAELRELLDANVVVEVEAELQRLDPAYSLRDADELRDLLVRLGDLSRDELAARCGSEVNGTTQLRWINDLVKHNRIVEVTIAGKPRWIAAEDAGTYRDALGISPPPGLPAAFLEIVEEPWAQLMMRFARTHVPFTPEDVAQRFGVGVATIRPTLQTLVNTGRLLEGEFLPGGRQREWCDAGVLKKIKRRSLARLREQVEPVSATRFARFLAEWQYVREPRRGLDGLLDVVEQLQGLPIPFSELEAQILPQRIQGFKSADLDELCAAGEIVWRGCQPLGVSDGYVALYLAESAGLLAPLPQPIPAEQDLDVQLIELLQSRGAMFFDSILAQTGGFKQDLAEALWRLVWRGYVTNDTLAPLRSLARSRSSRTKQRTRSRFRSVAFRSRRSQRVAGAEGRWSLFCKSPETATGTERQTAIATQLLERYGIVTREIVRSEEIAGGFSGLYPVLKEMEEAGRVRRGYFIEGQGGAQFAAPGADDRIRAERNPADDKRNEPLVLAATDPANPYGAAIAWPKNDQDTPRSRRATNAHVILQDGHLLGYLTKCGSQLSTNWPDEIPRDDASKSIVKALATFARNGVPAFLSSVDGKDVGSSTLASELRNAGFVSFSQGYQLRPDGASTG